MLCVLMTHMDDRESFLSMINQEKGLWEESTASTHDKIVKFVNDNSNKTHLMAYKVDQEEFDTISSMSKMNQVYLLWVDISLQSLFEKNLHNEWIIQLQERYQSLVGNECDFSNDVLIQTCILWMPSIT